MIRDFLSIVHPAVNCFPTIPSQNLFIRKVIPDIEVVGKPKINEQLLCARWCSRYVTLINSFNLFNDPERWSIPLLR